MSHPHHLLNYGIALTTNRHETPPPHPHDTHERTLLVHLRFSLNTPPTPPSCVCKRAAYPARVYAPDSTPQPSKSEAPGMLAASTVCLCLTRQLARANLSHELTTPPQKYEVQPPAWAPLGPPGTSHTHPGPSHGETVVAPVALITVVPETAVRNNPFNNNQHTPLKFQHVQG